MGNIICMNDKAQISEGISISNGFTDAFINVIGLSGLHPSKMEGENLTFGQKSKCSRSRYDMAGSGRDRIHK